MQPYLNTGRLKAFHIWPFLIGFITLFLSFYLTDLYLKQNFEYRGEAYMKGAGHLIQEDFWKAILFLSTRHLLVSTSCFYLFFGLAGNDSRRQLYKVLFYVAIAVVVVTLGYTIYQISNIITEGYDREDRIIEIALTWLLRATGFFLGYRLANSIFEHSSRKKYDS